jgi:hypothetical protein
MTWVTRRSRSWFPRTIRADNVQGVAADTEDHPVDFTRKELIAAVTTAGSWFRGRREELA